MITFYLKTLVLKNWTLLQMNKLVITLLFYFNLTIIVFANPVINARTGILVDYHSDEILYESDPDAQIWIKKNLSATQQRYFIRKKQTFT